MDSTIQEKLDRYLDMFDDIKQRTGDDETARVLLSEIAKDQRVEQRQNRWDSRPDTPATLNQRNYLRNLGAVIPEGLTKKKASELIDEITGRKLPLQKAIEVPCKD